VVGEGVVLVEGDGTSLVTTGTEVATTVNGKTKTIGRGNTGPPATVAPRAPRPKAAIDGYELEDSTPP
jgi:hypothetical protein